jgi:hypothetical protein
MFRRKYEPIQWRLTLDEWPVRDRRAFEAAVSKVSYRKAGQGAHWAPQTRLLRVASYGKFLQFLKLNGDCDETVDPADRLTPDRLTRYIAALKEHRAPASVAAAILDLGRVAMAMFPTRDWSWISQHPDRPTPQEIAAARKSKRTFDPAALLTATYTDAALSGAIRMRPGYQKLLEDVVAPTIATAAPAITTSSSSARNWRLAFWRV